MIDDTSNGTPRFKPASAPRTLPKRFYRSATVAPVAASPSPRSSRGEGIPKEPTASIARYQILLDGKSVRTPAKAALALPTHALAQAIAAEWESQGAHIDPETMPLTRIANSAIDGVASRRAEVAAEIVQYGASDLTCYRAEEPEPLVRRQAELWDPILAWARGGLGAEFRVVQGIMPVAQPDAARAALARALADVDIFSLAALHIITTLTGSALLALAHARGHIDADAAWAAAHVDEDFQVARWGEDAEAKARRGRRLAEMQAAAHLLALCREH
jgi:chaperone required for assembly of F1-ATPase